MIFSVRALSFSILFASSQLISAQLLSAGGFLLPHQSARALALGSAVTAGVKDASAVYYNPAALSEVEGNNLLVNGTYINVQSSVENSGRTATNRHDDNYIP